VLTKLVIDGNILCVCEDTARKDIVAMPLSKDLDRVQQGPVKQTELTVQSKSEQRSVQGQGKMPAKCTKI